MKYINFIFAFLLLALESCNESQSNSKSIEEIRIEEVEESENFSEFTKDISDLKIIPLETSENSFIRYVTSLIVSSDRIIVFDQYNMEQQVKVFDINGKVIATSSRGQGPGEIVKAYDVAYDEKLEKIIIHQNGYVSIFDKNLKYIEDKKCFGYVHLKVCGDNYIFRRANGQTNRGIGEEYNDYEIIVTDSELNIKYAARKFEVETSSVSSFDIAISKDGASFVEIECDTIYNIAEDKVSQKYILKYPNKLAPPPADLSVEEANDYIFSHSGYAFNGIYNENDTHQFIRIDNSKDKKQIIAYRDKNNKRTKQIHVDRENTIGNPFRLPVAALNDYFVSVLEYDYLQNHMKMMQELVSNEDYNLLKNMDEEANPVLVLYSFKPFE
ncbi:MAG: 6-bladed beta-propeller [Bacteroidales bacterium]|nr:6-bladed beta-propeller [Bacteroidales bacterium]